MTGLFASPTTATLPDQLGIFVAVLTLEMRRSAMPEVSVVILAHNAGSTIDAALASVTAQTFHD